MSRNSADTRPAEVQKKPRAWFRLCMGTVLGALIGAGLAWFAAEARQAEEEGDPEVSVGTGELVSLGIEVLGLFRTLFRLLKRL